MKAHSFDIGDKVTVLNLPDDQKGVVVARGITVADKPSPGSKGPSKRDTTVWWQVKLRGSARIVEVPSDQLTLLV